MVILLSFLPFIIRIVCHHRRNSHRRREGWHEYFALGRMSIFTDRLNRNSLMEKLNYFNIPFSPTYFIPSSGFMSVINSRLLRAWN
jgi:hypothetical protein